MEEILIASTDRTILVFIPDPASTTGAGKTGLVAASITVTYTRVETDNDVVNSDVTSSMNDLSALTDAHNDWGWKEVSSTLTKGLYRLDLADAVFASGAWYAVVQVTITSGTAAATPKAFKLVNLDMFGTPATNLATSGTNYSATRGLSGTALPAAAADAAGGLIISDAGGLDADAQLVTKINDILTDTGTTLDGKINTIDGIVDAILVDTTAIKAQTDKLTFTVANQIDANVLDWKSATAPAMTGDAFARLGAPAGASVSADVAAIKTVADAVKAKTDSLTFTVSNQIDANVIDWKGATAPAMTGDAFARLGAPAGASVSADVAAVKSDTAGIKTKTDSLTFTTAGFVDANVQYVNDVEVNGTGTAIDPWGP